MEKIKFFKDLERFYKLVELRDKKIEEFYQAISKEETKIDKRKKEIIKNFLSKMELEDNLENRLAIVNRIVNLRTDALKQALEKKELSENEIEDKLKLAYEIVSNFYIKEHETLINQLEKEKLLSKFFIELIKGVHKIGISFTKWQTKWTKHIIYTINKELFELFNGDEEKIFLMLNEKNLLDKGHTDEVGDRSYSALIKNDNGEFESRAYCDIFEKEVNEVVWQINNLINKLQNLEENIFNQKNNFIEYFEAISIALKEKNTNKLIQKWANVDRKWMKITTPIQIGHPLEYYEDHYRKAVALEWDLRIINPNRNIENIKEDIKTMYNKYYAKLKNVSHETKKIYNNSLKNLERVQLYLGRAALFYGAEFDGMFSAQVVPNDEIVSQEEGKKIFAFADKIHQSAKAKPFLKIHKEIYPEDFLHKSRVFLFQKEEIWHKIYNITTIGHEYGHILWIDNDSESKMNKNGAFKNIEEFKATTSGLVSFFENEQKELIEYILIDLIQRAVGLISWRETPEVLPYYCEGLIHLQALFDTEVLKFDKKLIINENNYQKLKEWYQNQYLELAKIYLQKEDAKKFLEKFLEKEKKSYLPKDEKIKYFVNYYWKLYKEIGQVIDDTIDKKIYLGE